MARDVVRTGRGSVAVAPSPGARFGSRHACTPPTRTQPAPDPRPDGARLARPLPPLPARAPARGGRAAPAAAGWRLGRVAAVPFGLRVATSVRARGCRIGHRGAVPSRSHGPGSPRGADGRPRSRRSARWCPPGAGWPKRRRAGWDASGCDSDGLSYCNATGHVFVTLSKKRMKVNPGYWIKARDACDRLELCDAVWRCG